MRHAPSPTRIASSVPPTRAEAAALSVEWKRRGLLGRLVRPEKRQSA